MSTARPRYNRRQLLGRLGLGLLALPAAATAMAARDRRIEGARLGLRANAPHDQSAALAAAITHAARHDAILVLPGGVIRVRDLQLSHPLRIIGQRGAALALAKGGSFLLSARSGPVHLQGLHLLGKGAGASEEDALVRIADCPDVRITRCAFQGGAGNGLFLRRCSGTIAQNRFTGAPQAAIFSLAGIGLRISGNHIADCGNNGILIWQPRKSFDGAQVRGNVIRRIRADAGGDGPNGNGINVFRAAGVTISDNVITGCAYSAIRDNAGDDCRIIANRCENIGEVAIFVEFRFRNAQVRDNHIRHASAGISITNMREGGRGAIVTGNVIRDIAPRIASEDVLGYGIWAEAETAITANLVERAVTGLWLGWGKYLDRVTAKNNTLRQCHTGIAVSVAKGAGRAIITGNRIEQPARAAIVGFDHDKPVTGDLLAPGAPVPANISLSANLSTRKGTR